MNWKVTKKDDGITTHSWEEYEILESEDEEGCLITFDGFQMFEHEDIPLDEAKKFCEEHDNLMKKYLDSFL